MSSSPQTGSPQPKPPATNRLGHPMNVYKGAESTLCAGCGHDSITAQLIRALWESDVDPYMVAKMSGAEFVVGVDIAPERLDLARRMGADFVFHAKEVDVVEEAARISKGLGMDIVVELTGNKRVVNDASRTLRRGGDIVLVVSNHEDLRSVTTHFGLPFHHIPVRAGGRDAAEAEAQALLDREGISLIVLARYMQILSPGFVARWEGRIINIHHSFLPAFAGARPYHQARQRGVKIIGATAHYVTAELDQGPIIEQDVARVTHRDEVDDMVRKGRDLERQVLARAVRLHLDRRVLTVGNRTVIFS